MNRSFVYSVFVIASFAMFVSGCKRDAGGAGEEVPAVSPKASAKQQAGTDAAFRETLPVHDPAHPPIDCPLRRQGIDPNHLSPFEETEKYIAFLEREDRAAWQKPDEVVEALKFSGDETVVDIGAGSGYFSFRFAKALPRGAVVSGDVEPEMVRHLHHKAMMDNVKNLDARVINPDDPAVPKNVDLVFICDVLHHVSDRPAWLRKIAGAMPRGARLALLEFKEGNLPEGPPESMKIPRSDLIRLVTDTGLSLTESHDDLLPYQTFLVFTKP